MVMIVMQRGMKQTFMGINGVCHFKTACTDAGNHPLLPGEAHPLCLTLLGFGLVFRFAGCFLCCVAFWRKLFYKKNKNKNRGFKGPTLI